VQLSAELSVFLDKVFVFRGEFVGKIAEPLKLFRQLLTPENPLG
jgi:hypothetical protein